MDWTEVAARHGTDKGTEHTYMPVYQLLVGRLRTPTILEIGVGRGASLRMWRELFPAAVVHGVDIDPDVSAAAGDLTGCEVRVGDATDLRFVAAAWPRAFFDLIVDDGSHEPRDQILSAVWCWPLLKPGGLHVIEDVRPETVEYLTQLGGLLLDHREVLKRFDDVLFVRRKPTEG